MDSVVCLFDENMNYAEGDVLGSDLTRKLRSENFTGLIIIRSANDSEESAQKYRAAGADRALSKGTSQKIVAQEIKQILAMRSPPSASATPPISNEQNKELTCIALDDDKAPRALSKGLFKMLGCSSYSQILGEHHHEAANISETVWAAVSKVRSD